MENRPIVLYTNKEGQLAHKIARYVQFAGLAADHDFVFLHTAFGQYAQFFNSMADELFCPFTNRRAYLETELFRFLENLFLQALLTGLSPDDGGEFGRLLKCVEEKGLAGIDPPLMPWARETLRHFGLGLTESVRQGQFAEQIHLISGDKPTDIRSDEFLQQLDKNAVVIVNGDLFFDHSDTFKRHYNLLVSHFRPLHCFEKRVWNFERELRQNCEVLVGVHIRMGDMRTWLGGKYFITTEQYVTLMEQVQALFPGRKVRFLISTNEELPAAQFAHLDCRFGLGHLIEDLYSLAVCDYVLGPPSGFSWWASLYGRKPLYLVDDITKNPTLADFKLRYLEDNPYFATFEGIG